jgi:hypothetical protein
MWKGIGKISQDKNKRILIEKEGWSNPGSRADFQITAITTG